MVCKAYLEKFRFLNEVTIMARIASGEDLTLSSAMLTDCFGAVDAFDKQELIFQLTSLFGSGTISSCTHVIRTP